MSIDTAPDQADILIVDDTPANLRLLSQILMGKGYRVRAVTSGARALESAHLTSPNLILLDIRMPEMNGYEVCERLKAKESTRHIPVIFISALDDVQDKVKGFQVGGVDYITKPFQIEEVLARTETHLSLHSLQQQLQTANERYARELSLAGKIQLSLLPKSTPEIPGWQLCAGLIPARETSGDFYDFVILPGGNLAILVADVVDKGAGAALIMALTQSLVRTYLVEHPMHPSKVLGAVNRRLLNDTHTDQFVTLFLGILDPLDGQLTYANASQCTPFFLPAMKSSPATNLLKTGPPLGLFIHETWHEQSIEMGAGGCLVIYTDGIPEAQSPAEEFFGLERLLGLLQARKECSPTQLQQHVLSNLKEFTGNKPPEDDIALVILKRDAGSQVS